ncbi:hypothetical protein OUZ56_012319 [Daphnia magna]|uniref:Uncharacterized protein n=1 Tax=Daphnia magna TaxID=35525 RepID=A0ABQ9Z2N4_9CRUS|nr:hypothetical protein OUZ56_012319 [Daphnia magna]
MSITHLLPRTELAKFGEGLVGHFSNAFPRKSFTTTHRKIHPVKNAYERKRYWCNLVLGLTEDNYDEAIPILNGKYNKPGSAKADHFIAITELPRVDRVENYKPMRKLHDQAMGHALNLGNLESASAQNEAISEIVTQKLPLELVSRCHEETTRSRKTLKDLFTFIDSVAEDWEYAFSTKKKEKRKATKQESAEKQQRVTFASTLVQRIRNNFI